MKRELALQLLQTILPDLKDEAATATLFRELQLLAEYKYNKYEMYHPGRLFLENLYLWLLQLQESERASAVDFVRKDLIFVSRQEFQQLASILYHDGIQRRQTEAAARLGGYTPYRVRAIRESQEFRIITRSSLYVGMSDGARIDYIRRHNLEISNEQVLPYYETSTEKVKDLLRELRRALCKGSSNFRCLFLLDDFCGSGRTLLREVVRSKINGSFDASQIPLPWRSRLKFDPETSEIELLYEGKISTSDQQTLLSIAPGETYLRAVKALVEKCNARETVLKGALAKVADGPLATILDKEAIIFFCPLLTTEHALNRLHELFPRLDRPFSRMKIEPGAVLDSTSAITSPGSPMGSLCEKYYTDELGDHHTGCVKFGFDSCGLPLILHHNTPNNSIYLLWARKGGDISPLFVRYERHGREES